MQSIVKDCSPPTKDTAIVAHKSVLVFLLAGLHHCDWRKSLFSMFCLVIAGLGWGTIDSQIKGAYCWAKIPILVENY